MPFLQIRAYGADPEAALQLGKNGGPPQHGANSSRARRPLTATDME